MSFNEYSNLHFIEAHCLSIEKVKHEHAHAHTHKHDKCIEPIIEKII
jgi:hypothetical protein